MENNTIIFNSKSKEYYLLSNFYGGVECCYMQSRFKNPEIKELFNDFESCDNDKFIYYLKELQPNKNWTEKKLNYWFKDGEPIRGILSKLVGTSVKNTPTGKKRLEIIKKLAKVDHIEINPELNESAKKQLMIKCLRDKYTIKIYRDILLSTDSNILHEKPMRGTGDNWTYPGNDWLGELLMKIRNEISN